MDRTRDREPSTTHDRGQRETSRWREQGYDRDDYDQNPRGRQDFSRESAGSSWNREGENFDREGYTRERGWSGREGGGYEDRGRWSEDRERNRLSGQEPHRTDWDRDREGGRSGGYGQGSAGGYNEQQYNEPGRWQHQRWGGEHDRDRGSEERGGWGRGAGSEEGWGRSDRYTGSRYGSESYGGGGISGSMSGSRGQGQYDRGGRGAGYSQYGGGGTSSSGAGYGTQQHSGTMGGYSPGQHEQHAYRGQHEGQHTGAHWSGTGYAGVGTGEMRPHYGSWTGTGESHREDYGREEQHGGGGIMESIGRFFGFGPKNYKRSDERLTEEINDSLYRHPDIDARDVEVSVKNGEATLTGHVDSRRAKYMAEELAERVYGVSDVNNQLRVRKHQESSSLGSMGMGGSSLGTSHTGTTSSTGTSSHLATGATTSATTTGNTGIGTGGSTAGGTTLGQSQTGSTKDLAGSESRSDKGGRNR